MILTAANLRRCARLIRRAIREGWDAARLDRELAGAGQ
jgi:hypothetical protein